MLSAPRFMLHLLPMQLHSPTAFATPYVLDCVGKHLTGSVSFVRLHAQMHFPLSLYHTISINEELHSDSELVFPWMDIPLS